MSEHTPEPWRYGKRQNVTDANGKTVVADGIAFATGVPSEESKDVSRRIVACVNACAGIPTEQLGDVKALAEAAGAALQYIYLAYVQEGQAKRDELASIAKRDFDALDVALAPFRKD